MKALVVGYGSIGSRHAKLLMDLGCATTVVSKRKIDFQIAFSDLKEAFATSYPDYVVVANATNQHRSALVELGHLGYTGTVLVEKPLFLSPHEMLPFSFRKLFVAYNLRFHPVILRLKELLAGERVLSVHAYAGQYLPDWRPASDYRVSYSASAEQGGGVLRDLSHELDYLIWMLGKWERVCALGGHVSSLEISSEDVFAMMIVTEACPIVTVQLNYLDRLARRFVIVNTSKRTIEADLIEGTIRTGRDIERFVVSRDDTYLAMHKAVLSGDLDSLCSLEEGVQTLRLIEAAESAAEQGSWIER